MTDWQPIETAPKDGTELIGFRPDQGVFSFRWASMEEIAPAHDESFDDFECWWHDRWGWMEGDLTPTLWMNYPPSPA